MPKKNATQRQQQAAAKKNKKNARSSTSSTNTSDNEHDHNQTSSSRSPPPANKRVRTFDENDMETEQTSTTDILNASDTSTSSRHSLTHPEQNDQQQIPAPEHSAQLGNTSCNITSTPETASAENTSMHARSVA